MVVKKNISQSYIKTYKGIYNIMYNYKYIGIKYTHTSCMYLLFVLIYKGEY